MHVRKGRLARRMHVSAGLRLKSISAAGFQQIADLAQ